MKKAAFIVAIAVLCLLAASALAQGTVELIYPSPGERVITECRDFYVIASVPDDVKSAVVRVKDANGFIVREITGGDSPTFYLEYKGLNAFNTDQAEYFMPDLIYRPDDPDSLWDGSIKAYVKNGLMCAVVPGGQYKMDGRAIVDGAGQPYAPLTEGEYTLEVEAGGQMISAQLLMGVTPAKTMARFSPAGHLNTVIDNAGQAGLHNYFDPFPGYWSPSSILPGQEKNPYFAEIKDRWQLADAMEYMQGDVHFFVYNLSPTCATVAVELARLNMDNAVDSPRFVTYHYDIGEPLLGYPEIETGAYLMGRFTPFLDGDYLAITRAEVTAEAQDNFYVAYEGEPRAIDLDVYDGLTTRAGDTLTLFGVLRPIQNDMADLTPIGESAWEVGNRIEKIEYVFACEDATWTERKDVGLNRMLAEGWQSYSVYEFAHAFRFSDVHVGEIVTVTLKGYDAHGAEVDGASETLTILITE